MDSLFPINPTLITIPTQSRSTTIIMKATFWSLDPILPRLLSKKELWRSKNADQMQWWSIKDSKKKIVKPEKPEKPKRKKRETCKKSCIIWQPSKEKKRDCRTNGVKNSKTKKRVALSKRNYLDGSTANTRTELMAFSRTLPPNGSSMKRDRSGQMNLLGKKKTKNARRKTVYAKKKTLSRRQCKSRRKNNYFYS